MKSRWFDRIKEWFYGPRPKCPEGYNEEQWEAHLAWAEKATDAELRQAVDEANAEKYWLLMKRGELKACLAEVDPNTPDAIKAREILAKIEHTLKFYA